MSGNPPNQPKFNYGHPPSHYARPQVHNHSGRPGMVPPSGIPMSSGGHHGQYRQTQSSSNVVSGMPPGSSGGSKLTNQSPGLPHEYEQMHMAQVGSGLPHQQNTGGALGSSSANFGGAPSTSSFRHQPASGTNQSNLPPLPNQPHSMMQQQSSYQKQQQSQLKSQQSPKVTTQSSQQPQSSGNAAQDEIHPPLHQPFNIANGTKQQPSSSSASAGVNQGLNTNTGGATTQQAQSSQSQSATNTAAQQNNNTTNTSQQFYTGGAGRYGGGNPNTTSSGVGGIPQSSHNHQPYPTHHSSRYPGSHGMSQANSSMHQHPNYLATNAASGAAHPPHQSNQIVVPPFVDEEMRKDHYKKQAIMEVPPYSTLNADVIPTKDFVESIDKHVSKIDTDLIRDIWKTIGVQTSDERVLKVASAMMEAQMLKIVSELKMMNAEANKQNERTRATGGASVAGGSAPGGGQVVDVGSGGARGVVQPKFGAVKGNHISFDDLQKAMEEFDVVLRRPQFIEEKHQISGSTSGHQRPGHSYAHMHTDPAKRFRQSAAPTAADQPINNKPQQLSMMITTNDAKNSNQ